jgi:general transcription factor 3C polypeptide 1
MSSKQGTVKMLGDGHTVTVLSVQSEPNSSLCSQNLGDKETMSTPEDIRESDCCHACERHIYHPILPWINGDGSMNSTVYEGLTRRIIGYVMQFPGIVEVCIYFFPFISACYALRKFCVPLVTSKL